MFNYVLKRVAYIIPTVLGISVLTFVMIRLIPGDPGEVILGQHATGEAAEIIRKQLGLDKPIFVQYFYWLKNILVGNWGKSIFSGDSVLRLILFRFGYTAQLALLSIAIITIFGILLGVLSAWKANSIYDNLIRGISILFWSSPYFITALVLLVLFGVYLPLFPIMGAGGIEHLILPSFSLSLAGIVWISRLTRGSMLEIAGQNFILTAEAKGLPKRRIIFTHILKNSILPVITMLGIEFGWLLSGSFLVETIFSYPGLGELTVRSILNRDYPVVQGCVIFIATIYCLINLAVDILYAFIDPRVRYGKVS